MKLTIDDVGFPILLAEDLFTQQEQDLMLRECLHLLPKFVTPEKSGTAVDKDGMALKRNKCLFMDDVYANREISDILTINRKIYSMLHEASDQHWYYFSGNSTLRYRDYTLLSYYENSDEYRAHIDNAEHTFLTWFYKEPKKFQGGDLIFPDFNKEIKCRKNLTVIFPSSINHQVTPVVMEETDKKGWGRFTMTQFISKYWVGNERSQDGIKPLV